MNEESDWTQADPTKEQIEEWMRQHKGEFSMFGNDSALLLARAAHEHFARPYHINVLRQMAETIYDLDHD
jgi:hypothetical protein